MEVCVLLKREVLESLSDPVCRRIPLLDVRGELYQNVVTLLSFVLMATDTLPVLSIEVVEATTSTIRFVWGPLGPADLPDATGYVVTIHTESSQLIRSITVPRGIYHQAFIMSLNCLLSVYRGPIS